MLEGMARFSTAKPEHAEHLVLDGRMFDGMARFAGAKSSEMFISYERRGQ